MEAPTTERLWPPKGYGVKRGFYTERISPVAFAQVQYLCEEHRLTEAEAKQREALSGHLSTQTLDSTLFADFACCTWLNSIDGICQKSAVTRDLSFWKSVDTSGVR